jgi:RNA polymerase sigma-70 factor (ECF subfamily)
VTETSTATASAHPGSSQEARLVAALRRGDEKAFGDLVREYHSSLVRVALTFVRERAVAEEVVQEAWLGVIRGIDRFEGRSSLKTWIFRILTNTAKTRAEREGRTVPFSALAAPDEEGADPAVDPDRFLADSDPRWPGHWTSAPTSWDRVPEGRLLAKETLSLVYDVVEALPPAQRQVITLRDIEGWSSEEVCELLHVSEGNQRVLLHRARAKVRAALEDHLEA